MARLQLQQHMLRNQLVMLLPELVAQSSSWG